MKERKLKILFFFLSGLLLAGLLLISRKAGISGDEYVHHRHAEKVYDWFASQGQDRSALHTPYTHLQHYGQLPDNLAFILIRGLGIRDVFGFRHLLSSFLGWLTIMAAALFVHHLRGYGAALICLLLFALSPRFLGHLQNNLKDIPFALGYVASLFALIRFRESGFSSRAVILLPVILSIAFCFSIRPGGILPAFYLILSGFLFLLQEYGSNRAFSLKQIRQKVLLILFICLAAYLGGLLIWPYALQNPLTHPWESYRLMTRFPTIVRQIFEGRFIWSDQLPWYYLPKYMLITIPLGVFGGLFLFLAGFRQIAVSPHREAYWLLVVSLLFPVLFVMLIDSNLYGGWRHFLFVYPSLVILSATGISGFFSRYRKNLYRLSGILGIVLLSVHPLRFMVSAHPYYYLYFNQLVGGIGGAYGNYETDYYYVTLRSGTEWLQDWLKKNEENRLLTIGSNFPLNGYFCHNDSLRFRQFTYRQRAETEWDYAVIGNSYIQPDQLKNGHFPPEGTLHTVEVEGVPVCAVVKRLTGLPLKGLEALRRGDYKKAEDCYRKALKFCQTDEHLWYRLGQSLFLNGSNLEAGNAVNRALELNAGYEPALALSSRLNRKQGKTEAAVRDLEKIIVLNSKYLKAYVDLAGILMDAGRISEAREKLRMCLRIHASYRPALIMLGDSFRKTDPGVAKKYYEKAQSITMYN
ncbi:MAG: tetratricopeptide repeat protein [Mangrovibacterium sp.]